MQVEYNKLGLGKNPDIRHKTFNIYAYYISGVVFIEIFDYSLSVNVKSLMEQKVYEYTGIMRHDLVKYGFMLHFVYDRESNSLRTFAESTPDFKDNPIGLQNARQVVKLVAKFISDPQNRETFGDIDLATMVHQSKAVHTPFDYQIFRINDLPKLYNVLRQQTNGDLGRFEGIQILAFDFNLDHLSVEQVAKQLGAINYKEKKITLSETPITLDGRRLDAPFIIIDTRIRNSQRSVEKYKNEMQLQSDLYNFISGQLNIPYMKREITAMENKIYYGYDLQDMYYICFAQDSEYKRASSVFDKSADDKLKEKLKRLMSFYNINPNDTEMVSFMKMFLTYSEAFPLSDKETYHKNFYSVVSIPNDNSGNVPVDPATKNNVLFNKIFKVKGDPLVSDNRIYYLLACYYLFPQKVYDLFIDRPQIEAESSSALSLHEVFEFNRNNGMLYKYSLLQNAPQEKEEAVFYETRVMHDFPAQITKTWGEGIRENRYDEKLIVRSLRDFPYAYDAVLRMFQNAGLEYEDINIVMMYDPSRSDMLGGYVPADHVEGKSEKNAIELLNGNTTVTFERPLIVLNIASNEMQNREHMSYILIHECKHYVEDKKVQYGLEPPSYLQNPVHINVPLGHPEFSLQKSNYLRSTPETNAFYEESVSILRHYSTEYVLDNWPYLKNKMIYEYFRPEDDSIATAYADIADLALQEFKKERGVGQ